MAIHYQVINLSYTNCISDKFTTKSQLIPLLTDCKNLESRAIPLFIPFVTCQVILRILYIYRYISSLIAVANKKFRVLFKISSFIYREYFSFFAMSEAGLLWNRSASGPQDRILHGSRKLEG